MNSPKNLQTLYQALLDHGRENPGKWIIPGWDGDSIRRAIEGDSVDSSAPTAHALHDRVHLVGIKNGVATDLGSIPMPPQMKLREIMRTYFSGSPDDEESEVSMAVAAGMEFFKWLGEQGYSQEREFYRKRCDLLQEWQSRMRDPERTIVCDILANGQTLPDPDGARYGRGANPVASLWVHPGRSVNGERLHTVKVLDWDQLPQEGTVDLHLGQPDRLSKGPSPKVAPPALSGKPILVYSLLKTTRRLTFDIRYQAPEVTYMGDDDGPYYSFTASNGYQVISRSRMDIQTERIWLLGARRNEETRSGSMVFSSDEKRDAAYEQFNIALAEWATSHGGNVQQAQ